MSVKPGTPEYYEDSKGEVRWRVRAANGEITEASSEGFIDLRNAFDNYTMTRSNVQVAYNEAQEQFHGHPIATSAGSDGEPQSVGLEGIDASEEDADPAEEGAGGTGGIGFDPEAENPGPADSAATTEGRAEE